MEQEADAGQWRDLLDVVPIGGARIGQHGGVVAAVGGHRAPDRQQHLVQRRVEVEILGQGAGLDRDRFQRRRGIGVSRRLAACERACEPTEIGEVGGNLVCVVHLLHP